MKRQLLSSNELAILTALWEAGQPLSRPQLLERITKTDWNPNSINVILNNMIKKGYMGCRSGMGRIMAEPIIR